MSLSIRQSPPRLFWYNTRMFFRLRKTYDDFPSQFWLMVVGLFISSIGSSMIWPFLMIYVSETLGLSLSTVATLVSINAGTGLVE